MGEDLLDRFTADFLTERLPASGALRRGRARTSSIPAKSVKVQAPDPYGAMKLPPAA